MSSRARRRGRFSRALRLLARGLGILLLSVIALTALALAAANLPWTRARIAELVSRQVSEAIAGTLAVTRLGHVNIDGVSGLDAHLLDPAGRRVATLSNASADLNLSVLIRSLIGADPLTLEFEHLSASALHAELREGSGGQPSIVQALAPATPDGPEPDADQSQTQPLRLVLPEIVVEQASIEGSVGGLDPLDLELRDLAASFRMDESALRFDLRHLELSADQLPVVGELNGELTAAGTFPRQPDSAAALEPELLADFSGEAAGIPVHARARYDAGRLAGYVDLEASSGAVQRVWPDTAIEHPVTWFVGFEGPLDNLQINSILESRAGRLYLQGTLDAPPPISGELTLIGLGLAPGRWLEAVPESSAEFVAAVRFAIDDGELVAQLALRAWSLRLEGRSLPALALSARTNGDSARATLRLEGAGADAELQARVPSLSGPVEDWQIELELDLDVRNAARLAEALGLAPSLRGQAEVNASAVLELRGVPFIASARLEASAQGVSAGAVRLARARLDATARGSLASPSISASATARELAIAGYELSRIALSARGSLQELELEAALDPVAGAPAVLSAELLPKASAARDLRLILEEGESGGEVRVTARRVAFTDGAVSVEDFELVGAGRVQLDASLRGERVRASGSASDFSAAAVARKLGLSESVPRGVADVAFELDYRPGHASGALQGRLSELELADAEGGYVDMNLAVDDNVLTGAVTACLAPIGQAELWARSVELPATWEPEQLSRLTGELDLLAAVDLSELTRAAAATPLPPTLRGQLRARLHVTGVPGEPPRLELLVSTDDLAWSAPDLVRDSSRGMPSTASQWQGLDVQLATDISGSRVRAAASVLNADGKLLADLQGQTQLPLERLLRAPETIDPRALPFQLQARIPERELDAFPLPERVQGLDGVVSATVEVKGTLGQPTTTAHVHIEELQLEDSPQTLPLAITVDAELEGSRLQAAASIRNEQQKLVSLQAEAVVSGGGQPPAIERLDVNLRSNGLPLEPLGTFAGLDISGELFGALHIQGLGATPVAKGTLWVNEPEFGGVRQEQARWVIDADANSFRTQLYLEQDAGRAQLTAHGPWRWQGVMAPEPRLEATELSVEARNFDLQALRAALPEQVRALQGRVDAELRLDPGAPAEGAIAGNVHLTQGAIYVAALGQEFRDIRLDAEIAPSGAVRIERLSGRALRGRFQATGQAQLEGLSLDSAQLSVRIPSGDPLPIMIEGVTLADVSGRLQVAADAELQPERGPRTILVEVDVPRLQVELPEQSPRNVQELEPDPTITTGTYQRPEQFIALPLPPYTDEETDDPAAEPLVLRIDVELGDDVWIERGTQLEVKLDGAVELLVREEVSARGEVRLTRGTLDVQGRVFEIEEGVITFVPGREPTNPTVVATASYMAPEGTTVYAEFVGPVETGNLSLRSDPPLRDDQILSLLLFGTPDGNFGSSTGEGTMGGTALAAGGSVVTKGLNHELRKFTSLDIQTRIGEAEGEPQPEVIVQISPRLSAELAYNLTAPTPGRAQDRTYLTLDLRVFRNWSLSTTIGDAGSLLLDLLWRVRY